MAICCSWKSLRLHCDVQSPWATRVAGEMQFYPPSLEFWIPVPFLLVSLPLRSLLCIFFPCLFSVPSPQEQRIMLFRFAYTSNFHTQQYHRYRCSPTFRHCSTDFSPRRHFDTSANSCNFDLTSSRPRAGFTTRSETDIFLLFSGA